MRFVRHSTAGALVAAAVACASPAAKNAATETAAVVRVNPGTLQGFTQTVSGTNVKIEMAPIPGGELTVSDPVNPTRKNTVAVRPFFMGTTELTFDAFDVFIYALDEPDPTIPAAIDGVTRPSKPYIPPDKGFGHQGYPAIGMSFKNAAEFCQWLSKKSGRKYRLPTEAEWEFACRAGSSGKYFFGDDAAKLDEFAWYRGTTENTTKGVGGKKPNPFGLHDILGNVQEWCQGHDGKPMTRGGSFRDTADKVTCDARVPANPAWNASDPQVPKSQWWMVDCAFVGFRVVCEP